MKIYLSLNSVEELKTWNKKAKKEAWRGVYGKMHRSPLPWIGYLILVVFMTAFLTLVPEGNSFPIRASIAGGIGGFLMSQFQLRAAIPLMKEWIEANRSEPDAMSQT